MDNNELLQQIAVLFEQQEERINQRFEQQEKWINQKFEQVDNQFRNLELKIEHDVSNRIEALFDGYKLTHEKQWELERKIEQLERRIERLEQVG